MNTLLFILMACAFTLTACSPAQDCENSNTGVRYVVTGKNVDMASITLSSDSAGMEMGDYELPYCRIMTGFEEGDQLYISARNKADSGSVTCKIYVEDELVSQSTANLSTACTATK